MKNKTAPSPLLIKCMHDTFYQLSSYQKSNRFVLKAFGRNFLFIKTLFQPWGACMKLLPITVKQYLLSERFVTETTLVIDFDP